MKYRSTEVPVSRSVSKIERMIVEYGAGQFTKTYDGQSITGISFTLVADRWGIPELPIEISLATDDVLDRIWMSYSVTHRNRQGIEKEQYREHAEKMAWRQMKDLVEQLLLAFETGIMNPVEMFFGYVVVTDPETGQTRGMGELFLEKGLLTPAAGGRLLIGTGS